MVTVQKYIVSELQRAAAKPASDLLTCTCTWHFGMDQKKCQRNSTKVHTTKCLHSCAAVNMLLQKAELHAASTVGL